MASRLDASTLARLTTGLFEREPAPDWSVLAEQDEQASTLAARTHLHPDYGRMAGRVTMRLHHDATPASFSAYAAAQPSLAPSLVATAQRHATRLEAALDHARDEQYDYFAWRTLLQSYLLRRDGAPHERPQHLWMRVALGIHGDDLEAALETYEALSRGDCIHATPTLFNAGTTHPQLASCFLVAMKDDSIEGIYDTLKECALISKSAGGIGLHVHNVRAKGAPIRGTDGQSNGLVPMLRNFNATARYVDQGGGKRKGSFAIYLEPHHADVLDFLELKRNQGADEIRARDLFYGLWVSDLFMRRVRDGETWSLFCPNACPELLGTWGEQFEARYLACEREGRASRQLPARELWNKIVETMLETGTPYLLFKDACNAKSNQQNVGVVQSSNLCCEIVQVSTPEETAVCNLASVALPRFRAPDGADPVEAYDYAGLGGVVALLVRNLNKVIDRTTYPVPEAARSNRRHRPIAVGVQGLHDVYMHARLPFDDPRAAELNRRIFATIYYYAVDASVDLAVRDGPYTTFEGSPASEGRLQFDLWGVAPHPMYDWAALRQRVRLEGLRNSLLVGLMPTASSATILMNSECFEPLSSNLYVRRTLAGEVTRINPHLVSALEERGHWTDATREALLRDRGSVARLPDDVLPPALKAVFRTAYELPMRGVIDQSADRGIYVCQSSSKNLFLNAANATQRKLTSMLFHSWTKGEKTGVYYTRTQPKANALQVVAPSTPPSTPPSTTADGDDC